MSTTQQSMWWMAESAAAIVYAAVRDWPGPEVGTTYVCADTEQNHRIVARLRASVGHYSPPALWSYSPHLVSVLSADAAAPGVQYDRQTLVKEKEEEHDVDDDVHIDWWPPRDNNAAGGAILLLFPGLGVRSSCPGPRAFAATVAAAGHRCGVVNPTCKWHPTRTKEAERVLAAVAAEWGTARLTVVGMSGSSTILSHVLARAPRSHLPQLGAVLCCFVTDYGAALDRLEAGSVEGRAYSRLLAARLRSLMGAATTTTTTTTTDDASCKPGCLLSDLDAVATRGFGSVAALRAAMQTEALLARIPIPCLLVQPADDPLQTLSDAPQQRKSARRAARANANLVLVEPTHGAHLGFRQEENYHPAQLALVLADELRRQQIGGGGSSKKRRKG